MVSSHHAPLPVHGVPGYVATITVKDHFINGDADDGTDDGCDKIYWYVFKATRFPIRTSNKAFRIVSMHRPLTGKLRLIVRTTTVKLRLARYDLSSFMLDHQYAHCPDSNFNTDPNRSAHWITLARDPAR